MDDRFSQFFLNYSESPKWLLCSVGALIVLVWLGFTQMTNAGEAVFWLTKLAISFSVFGVMGAWLAAQEHATNGLQKRWRVAMFLLWPMAYFYLGREFVHNRSSGRHVDT